MIDVFTDGASSGSPGISGAGIYIKDTQDTEELSIPLSIMTNHEAEFQAVIEALKVCVQHYPTEIIAIQSDSQLVVDAIERRFVKNKLYEPLLSEILQLTNQFTHVFAKWIPAKQNFHADRLAKQAILQQKNI